MLGAACWEGLWAYGAGRTAVKAFCFCNPHTANVIFSYRPPKDKGGIAIYGNSAVCGIYAAHKRRPASCDNTRMRAVRKNNIYSTITKNRKTSYRRAPGPVCPKPFPTCSPNALKKSPSPPKTSTKSQRIQFHLFKISPYLSQQRKLPDRLQNITDRI